MQILITFIIFTIICLFLTYYFNLFISQSVYTRSELSNILPQIGNMLRTIYNKYSMLYLAVFYFVSAFFAIFILVFIENWIINSALIPLILYYSVPRLAIYFEQTRVTITEDYKDIAEALYAKHYNYILIGFFSGFAAKLIDNWSNTGVISFYWFILNFAVIAALTVLTLRNDIFE